MTTMFKIIGALAIGFIVVFAITFLSWFEIVDPGFRGVKVTMGSVSDEVYGEGFHWKSPLSSIKEVNVRNQRGVYTSACYSSDLQQVVATITVIYSLPANNVVDLYKNYQGNPAEVLLTPCVQEAFKEVTATRSAERIVKDREQVKAEALTSLKRKIDNKLTISDIIIENLDLSNELERAIEQKMVQEQTAAKAQFAQKQAQIEAQTARIRAEGEANAIRIRGEALKDNKELVSLQIVEKWDGKTPQTVVVTGNTSPANILLPIK